MPRNSRPALETLSLRLAPADENDRTSRPSAAIDVRQEVLAIEDAASLLRVSVDWLLRAGCPHYPLGFGEHGVRARRFVRWTDVVAWITAGGSQTAARPRRSRAA